MKKGKRGSITDTVMGILGIIIYLAPFILWYVFKTFIFFKYIYPLIFN